MRATPIQRYALRLLFAAKKECSISYDRWTALQRDEADQLMTPFGGQEKIMREIQLPVKPMPEKTKIAKTTDSDAPARAERDIRGNGIELGE